jgi:hypothetical protein
MHSVTNSPEIFVILEAIDMETGERLTRRSPYAPSGLTLPITPPPMTEGRRSHTYVTIIKGSILSATTSIIKTGALFIHTAQLFRLFSLKETTLLNLPWAWNKNHYSISYPLPRFRVASVEPNLYTIYESPHEKRVNHE